MAHSIRGLLDFNRRWCRIFDRRERERDGHGWVVAAATLVAVACSNDGATPPSSDVDSITIDSPSATVPLGGTLQLTAHALDANGAEISGVQFFWSSDNENVISVSSSGLLTARGTGSVTISATASGKTGTALVSSSQELATIEVMPGPLGLAIGESTQLSAVLSDAQGNQLAGPAVTWTSGDESVVTVSTDGIVDAIGQGTTTITAAADGKSGTGSVTVSATPAPVSSVTIQPGSPSVAPGGSVQLSAVTKDASGNVLPGRVVVWSTSASSVATVSASGLVNGVATGDVMITATSEGMTGSVQVSVTAASAVATITLSPAAAIVPAGSVLQLTATVRDAAGNPLVGHVVGWASGGPAATVSSSGLVTGVQSGVTVTITAAAEGVFGTASISVIVPPVHTISLTPDPVTFGVGGTLRIHVDARDSRGIEVQDPAIVWTSSSAAVASVTGQSIYDPRDWTVRGNSAGTATLTVTADGVSATAAVTVTHLSLASVSVGHGTACGLSPSGAAFCWGYSGAVGTRSLADQRTPVAGSGGLSFAQISAGGTFACALTAGGAGYCWGRNPAGQLGAGSSPSPACVATTSPSDLVCPFPVPVSGGLAFKRISAGETHACGLVSDGTAYCWGENSNGQLGSVRGPPCTFGSHVVCSAVPAPVTGGLKFKEISAGYFHTCAVALDDAGYCWGENTSGELGTGIFGGRTDAPVAVVGGLTFSNISAGVGHSCGIVAGGLGYCWGDNRFRQLGTGATTDIQDSPAPVFGGIVFAQLDAGGNFTCGATASGVGYCWGRNPDGQLGVGDYTDRPLPTPILGGLAFDSVSVGNGHNVCGIVLQTTYCWGAQGLIGTEDHPAVVVPTRMSGQD